MIGAQPALGDPAADEGSGDAVDDRDGADDQAGVGHGEAGEAVQEFGHPVGDAAHGEGEGGQAEGGGEKGRVGEEAEEGGAVERWAGCGRWRRARVRGPSQP